MLQYFPELHERNKVNISVQYYSKNQCFTELLLFLLVCFKASWNSNLIQTLADRGNAKANNLQQLA